MLVVLKKRVWQVVLLLAMVLGVCYANSQADEYYKMAKSYDENKDYAKALQYLQKAADMGDARAYYTLGVLYTQGEKVEKAYFKAVQYFQKAAEMGNAFSYYNLGVMYKKGYGVGQDKEMARQYFKKACDLGDQQGCNNLKP
ncbi:tetratricopeptide repeat protein [Helicobacter ailurogastricus]|uniref:tetratricopeptide repeat protein n=1 Tax=Helicobacter ailurogastricus TaxID=1578720 RepID=UPI000CF1860C|nr:tetratricopeptide repeat protein [Helicobacter ailurogastricus]